jgi:hypothetical protein
MSTSWTLASRSRKVRMMVLFGISSTSGVLRSVRVWTWGGVVGGGGECGRRSDASEAGATKRVRWAQPEREERGEEERCEEEDRVIQRETRVGEWVMCSGC